MGALAFALEINDVGGVRGPGPAINFASSSILCFSLSLSLSLSSPSKPPTTPLTLLADGDVNGPFLSISTGVPALPGPESPTFEFTKG